MGINSIFKHQTIKQMDNFLYSELEHAERMQLLIKQSLGRETMTFKRTLSQLDVEDRRNLFVREEMRLATIVEEFKGYKARKMADIKAIEKNQEESLAIIANESVEVFDEVFLIPDHAENIVLFVDKLGEIVHRREMKPEERQGRLMLDESRPIVVNETENVEHFESIEFEEVGKGDQQGNTETKPEEPKRGRKKKTVKAPESTNGIPEADPDAMDRVKDM